MNDIEINKALALAIGWPEADPMDGICWVSLGTQELWREFDYREWSVIGPIAERYNVFPYMHKVNGVPDGKWVVWPDITEDTPQKAIAMAVIERATP